MIRISVKNIQKNFLQTNSLKYYLTLTDIVIKTILPHIWNDKTNQLYFIESLVYFRFMHDKSYSNK